MNDPPNLDPQSCFGFSITSEIDLRFTRAGASPEGIEVVEMRGSQPQHDEPHILHWLTQNGVSGRLYGGGQIFDFWAEGVGWYRIAPFDRTIEVPADADPIRREAHLWGVPTMVTFTRLGDLSLHAAAVERNGKAVLVAAPGRHGKTTLALALHAAGFRLLSEDIARVRFEPQPVVLPGPAVVRMRRGAVNGIPANMQVVGPAHRRVHLEIDRDRRGDAGPVPVAAVVILRRDDERPARLERADPAVAIRDMWALAFRVPSTADRARVFQQLADLTSSVPVHDLERPLTVESLPDVIALVEQLCS